MRVGGRTIDRSLISVNQADERCVESFPIDVGPVALNRKGDGHRSATIAFTQVIAFTQESACSLEAVAIECRFAVVHAVRCQQFDVNRLVDPFADKST